jgi:hypothetical protein
MEAGDEVLVLVTPDSEGQVKALLVGAAVPAAPVAPAGLAASPGVTASAAISETPLPGAAPPAGNGA